MTTHKQTAAEITEALLEDLTHRGGHAQTMRETRPDAAAALRARWQEIITEKLEAAQ